MALVIFLRQSQGLLGGLLATSSLLLPVQIQTVILFLCIPTAVSLVEPSIQKEDKIKNGFHSILKVVKFSLIENIKLRWLIIYSSIMGVATLSVKLGWHNHFSRVLTYL